MLKFENFFYESSESIEEILTQEETYKMSGLSDHSEENLDEMFAEEFESLHILVDPLDMGKSVIKVHFYPMSQKFRNYFKTTRHPEEESIKSYVEWKLKELKREME